MDESLCYLNGRLIPSAEASVSVADAGLVQGATVSELTRTFDRKLFRLNDHLDRLYRGLEHTQITIQLSREELRKISEELTAHNSGFLNEGEDLGLIHFVTAGEYPTYSARANPAKVPKATVCVHTFPLPFELWAERVQQGIRLVTPTIRHLPPQCQNPHVKCRSRMHFFLAEKEVRMTDPSASALLLDLEGNVTETNAANFFMVLGGMLFSPTLKNTLPGISRATVIELAAKLGIPFTERDIRPESVLQSEEAFLSSTPYSLMPATRFNGIPIGNGAAGPIYRRLVSKWSEEVGLDIERQIVEVGRRRAASFSNP